ncbi:hypothetical protein [Weissella confusa]|uniref:hypothetical protein n=1 Tax=Weissella confusa TaxID=1583 RepID=UPI0010812C2D|nr:hypothetical protein [Weissella confusa]MBA5932566.1 hypothetical protein [Weissella confusa]MBF7055152.1 hypothetical protein [Weissella confusa]MBJ7635987.1 hypothetical protein [Weissella confusa]MBJ7642547.1 hypothetical protein [Weissella confusa]MBJ7652371.1 hypothetical protein [Weissella confusa]
MGNTVKLMFGKIPETVGDELLAIHRLVTSELTTEQVRFLQAMSDVASGVRVANVMDIQEALDWTVDEIVEVQQYLIKMHVIQAVNASEIRFAVPNTKEYFALVEHPEDYVDVWRR